ncbi:uncharacterized protein F5891DRAFT_1195622 [Suillus fuscotomentosus]|uniref:Uncharacterized protein n=1 Tax=Suillus fuscotomentosus TaxID=1912939 RepID=A0AAD4DUM5_9AGAM|nr:uncharacterized protein F5891DRAFT_1195622 [Suillus fuscotomentosus]KAG1894067.1 hypothetical protein F5891DRAFT_1195622 [Suillus fuscotomentosus]
MHSVITASWGPMDVDSDEDKEGGTYLEPMDVCDEDEVDGGDAMEDIIVYASHETTNAYPLQRDYLRTIVENEQQLFANERTLGLITQALDRAPRWAIKKLTPTYLTLHLSDIGREVGISDENQVKSLILSMSECSEIPTGLSADGTASFSDPPVKFEKNDVDRVLSQAQQLLVRLEKEMERNKEYLTKAVKSKDDAALGLAMDEDGAFGDRPSGNWPEDISFA